MMNTHISTHRQLQVKGPAMTGHSAKNPTPQRCRVTAINAQSSVIPIDFPYFIHSPLSLLSSKGSLAGLVSRVYVHLMQVDE